VIVPAVSAIPRRTLFRALGGLAVASAVACGLDASGNHVGAVSGTLADAGTIDTGAAPLPDAGDAGTTTPIGAGGDDASAPDTSTSTSAPGPCDGGPALGDGGALRLVGPMAQSPDFGGMNGAPFDDLCLPGMALVGVDVSTSLTSSIANIQGYCAPLFLEACGVGVAPAVPMVDHGGTGGTPQSLRCPPGYVVVGVHAVTDLLVESLSLDCAPLFAAPPATISIGPITTVGPVGGPAGTANPDFVCPAPMIANELAGAAGAFVDSVRIGCATPAAP
jgi:hypothetical protein